MQNLCNEERVDPWPLSRLPRAVESSARPRLPSVFLWVEDKDLRSMILSRLTRDRYNVALDQFLGGLKQASGNGNSPIVVAEISGSEREFDMIRTAAGDTPTVLISRNNGHELQARAEKLGTFECLRNPKDLNELSRALSHVITTNRMALDSAAGIQEIQVIRDGATGVRKIPRLVAGGGAMLGVRIQVEKVAGLPDPVLIVGETGVGKEVVACWIHLLSGRRDKPFAVADLSAIPVTLLETALFGHVKGAFTGATVGKGGIVEHARDGTLFLDEVSDLPLEQQQKLLRLIDRSEFNRVGGAGILRTDARPVIATNKNLADLVERGLFREDLYHRLNVHQIRIPPLRERSEEDRHELALQIIKDLNPLYGTSVGRLGVQAFDQLMTYPWPGNVRQLVNAVRRSILGAGGYTLEVLELGPDAGFRKESVADSLTVRLNFRQPWRSYRDQAGNVLEKNYCVALMADCDGNESAAARMAGITRKNFWLKLKKHGLDCGRFRK